MFACDSFPIHVISIKDYLNGFAMFDEDREGERNNEWNDS